MGPILALVLMVLSGISAVLAIVFISIDHWGIRYDRIIGFLAGLAVLSFLASCTVVRIVEAGLW